MKNAYEVLREKEADLARIRHEVASLRIVVPLLSDDVHSSHSDTDESSQHDAAESSAEAESTGTDGLFSFATVATPKIWNVLKRSKQAETS